MAQYGKPRNYGFNTAVGEGVAENRNAIRAAIDADQVITAGAVVRLRLLKPMQVARYVLPTNTVVFGVAAIEGQRLSITVKSIESGGSIIPVQLTAHDTDGQPGQASVRRAYRAYRLRTTPGSRPQWTLCGVQCLRAANT